VSVLGRNTQGVRVIRTKEGEFLVGVERIDEPAPDPELFDDSDGDEEKPTLEGAVAQSEDEPGDTD